MDAAQEDWPPKFVPYFEDGDILPAEILVSTLHFVDPDHFREGVSAGMVDEWKGSCLATGWKGVVATSTAQTNEETHCARRRHWSYT